MATGGPTLQDLADALHSVAIGGNHLALIIGADHPPYTAHDDVAQRHYGDNLDTLNAWVCWKQIMTATREVYDQLPDDVRDACWKRSQHRRAEAQKLTAQEPRT